MGVDSPISCVSHPLHSADNGLAPFVDMDVFNRYFLLSFTTMTIQGFQKRGIGPRELVCLAEVFAPALKRLHGAAIAFHGGVVASNELCRYHAFELIVWIDANEPRDCGANLLFPPVLN